MKLFGLLISILLISNLYAQSNCDCFERLSELARIKSFEEKKDSALYIYKRALSFLPDSARTNYHDSQLAKYYGAAGHIDSAKHYLIKAIHDGYEKEFIGFYEEFNQVMEQYSAEVDEAYFMPGKNFDWNYYNRYYELKGIDQFIRKQPALKFIDRKQLYQVVDSIVLMEAIELINLYGYPQQAKHGFNIWIELFFMHGSMYSEDVFNRILQILNKANKNCLCLKETIALLKDRRLDWYDKKKQVAGTWNYPGEYNPIENLDEVDSIRFMYNMMNLYDDARINSKELPPGYTPEPYPKGYFCEDKSPLDDLHK